MLAVLGMPLLSGCDDAKDGYGDGYSNASAYCANYLSCGTCTPVVGCGWCTGSDGEGACAPGPEYCTGKAFSWTWETSGCRTSADASVSGDGGTVNHDGADGEAPASDAQAGDARVSSDAASDAASE